MTRRQGREGRACAKAVARGLPLSSMCRAPWSGANGAAVHGWEYDADVDVLTTRNARFHLGALSELKDEVVRIGRRYGDGILDADRSRFVYERKVGTLRDRYRAATNRTWDFLRIQKGLKLDFPSRGLRRSI